MRRLLVLGVVFVSCVAPVSAQEKVQAKAPTKQPDVNNGLRWLVSKQGRDGAWGVKNRLALTGMSGLALLSSRSTALRGPYAAAIRRAIHFVLQSQKRDGQAFTDPSSGYSAIHNHGYALLFLTQCYGEAGPFLNKRLHHAIELGLRATIASQFTEGMHDGGFGYFLRRKVIPRWNHMWRVDEASTTISQIQALRGARNAGFSIPRRALSRAGRYIARSQHRTGGFVYSIGNYRVSFEEGGTRPTFAITAACTAVLHALGTYQGPKLAAGIKYMEQFRPPYKRRKLPFYYYAHYYGAQVMYMKGGPKGQKWMAAINAELADRQRPDGRWAADPEDTLAEGDSEILNTAWALQICQIHKGALPLHER